MTDTFDFPFHQVAEDNPEAGTSVKFGNSWTFAAGPTAPLQRSFTLTMMGMRVYTNSDGSIDSTTNTKKNNIKVFYQFWKDHLQHVFFNYVHPLHGTMLVRFKSPLKLPTPIPGGSGVYPEFQIQLEEQPV